MMILLDIYGVIIEMIMVDVKLLVVLLGMLFLSLLGVIVWMKCGEMFIKF